jgi:hypothetical protein
MQAAEILIFRRFAAGLCNAAEICRPLGLLEATMKKITLILVILLLLPLFVQPVWAADPTPGDAVVALMEEIRDWDAVAVAAVVDEVLPGGYGETATETALLPLLARLEYTLGNTKITGGAAEVDIAVTAPDIKGFAGNIAAEAMGLAAIKRLTGLPVDVKKYINDRVAKAVADENLTTIKTDTTVYLRQGGDGVWRLDMTELRNLDFLGALSGGFLAFEEPLRSLFGNNG